MVLRIFLAVSMAALGIVAPALGADIKATSRIDAVTVYPSGATITRVATVKLDKGEHVIIFEDIAAQAKPGSIRVEGQASGALEIGSVDSRRVNVATDDAAILASQRKKIEDQIEALRDQNEAIAATIKAAQAQVTLMTNLAQLPLRPAAPGRAPAPAATATDWGQIYGVIGERLKDAEAEILKARIEQREINRQIKDLQGKLAELAPNQKVRTVVKVNVSAGAPLEAKLKIQYQIRRASWRPLYDARLSTGTKTLAPKLTLVRRATISQRSGEPWKDVKLSLSTSQPAAGSTAPVLYPVTVSIFEPPPTPVAMARPQRTRSLGQLRAAKPEAGGSAADNVAALPAAEKMPAPKKLKIRRRAARVAAAPFQAVFTVQGRQSVLATGEIKRVQLGRVSVEPSLLVHTVPKRLAKAFLYARFQLPKGTPYLPGQVQLFRDATFVGTGRLPLLRPKEEHDLGFGQDDSVLVKYAVITEKRGETGLISSTKTDTRNYKITVKNLHERAIDVAVFDQVPVSKNQDIRIEVTGRTKPTKRNYKDKRGVFVWESKLRSDAEAVIDFGYKISWPAAKRIVYGR